MSTHCIGKMADTLPELTPGKVSDGLVETAFANLRYCDLVILFALLRWLARRCAGEEDVFREVEVNTGKPSWNSVHAS